MGTILTIDIGNTSTSIGYYKDDTLSGTSYCPSKIVSDAEVLPLLLSQPVEKVVIASVVPCINKQWEEVILKAGLPLPHFIHHTDSIGVPIHYPNPQKIGADRLANAAIAAKVLGVPSVVCDFGTALTFDVLDQHKGYVGGIICPGLPLMFDYLSEKTALLPHVAPKKTTHVVGSSTEEAMQIGARIGYRGMVREILRSLQKELNAPDLPVYCTGGYAEWIFDDWDINVTIDPHLTLKGIGLIGSLNE